MRLKKSLLSSYGTVMPRKNQQAPRTHRPPDPIQRPSQGAVFVRALPLAAHSPLSRQWLCLVSAAAVSALAALALLTSPLWAFLAGMIGLMGLLIWGHDHTPLIDTEHLRSALPQPVGFSEVLSRAQSADDAP